MQDSQSLARLTWILLCSASFAIPASAATFNVGGGTVTTAQADASADNTGTGGTFILQPNTVSSGDTVTIAGVSIVNTSGSPSGRALDLGYTLPSSGNYAVTMQGSSLTALSGSGVAAIIESSSGGNISFDSTGGATNTIVGPIGVNLNANGGNIVINTGADTITTSGATGEILYGTTTGAGTIAIDAAGATLTSAGVYGIAAVTGGNGAITIGGLNGGMASTVVVNGTGGTGIYTSSPNATVNVSIAASGSVTAANGVRLQGGATSLDNFGTINATANAADASLASSLTATLENGSVNKGTFLGSSGADTFVVFTGANFTNATFNGSGGNDTLNLKGAGTVSFDLSKLTSVENLQKDDAGTWTLTGSGSLAGVSVNGGTLKAGAATVFTSSTAVAVNAGTLDANGNSLSIGPLSGLGGTINISSNTMLTSTSGTNTTYVGILAGSGGFIKSGSGTLVLTGNNTYSGGTTIAAGGLTIGNGGAGAAISGNVVDNGTLTFNHSDNITYNGRISGTGTLVQTGTGSLTLGSVNTYTGGTVVQSGTLGGHLGSGSVTINGGTLAPAISSSIGSLSGTGGTLQAFDGNINQTVNGSYAGVIVGASPTSITKSGSATLTLTGVSTFDGIWTVNAGTLKVSGAGAIGASSAAIQVSGATFDLGGTTQTLDGSRLNGSNTLGSGGVIQNGVLSSSGRAFNMGGGTLSASLAGTANLSGYGVLSGVNTYTGGTSVNGGTLLISGAGTLGATSNSLTVTQLHTIGVGFFPAGYLDLGGTTQTQNGGVNLLAGTIANGTLLSSGTFNLEKGSISASLGGTGSAVVSGAVTLSGTNTYSGGTTVTGTLSITSDSNLGSGSLTLDQTRYGTLLLTASGTYSHLLNLIGDASFLTASPAFVYVIAPYGLSVADGQTVTYSGVIADGAQAGVLQKAGNGTLILTGANTYSGGTSVSGGLLVLTTANNYGGGTRVSGGTLQLSGSGTLGASSNSVMVNGGTLDLGGKTQTQNGGVTVTGGTIQNGGLSSSGTFLFQDGSISAALSGTGAVQIAGGAPDALVSLSGVNSYSGGTSVINTKLQGNTTSLQGNISNNVSVIFNQAFSGTYGGVLSGSGDVTVYNGGTVTFTGANTYTGGTRIDFATLQIGDGGTAGAIMGDVLDLGTLVFNRSDTVIFAGNIMASSIQSTGQLVQMGPGTLTLTGTSTYTAGTTIAAGTLQLGNGGTTGSITGDVVDNGILAFNHSNAISFSGLISGRGDLSQSGSGTVTLGGFNTYSGATAIASGSTLALSGSGSIASSSNVIDNGTLDISARSGGSNITNLSGSGSVVLGGQLLTLTAASGTFGGVIAGSGGLALAGGSFTLSGNHSYTGATSVQGGTLNVMGTLASGVTVQNGATLAGTGSIGALTVQSGGAVAPGVNAVGTLSVSGNVALGNGDNYQLDLTPDSSDRISAGGTASLSGALTAVAAPGTYAPGQRYTLISATSGLSGTFTSFAVIGLPSSLRGQLSYDASNAYLVLAPGVVSPGLPANATTNTANVAGGIDNAIKAGATVPAAFTTLYYLDGGKLTAALDQLSGKGSANVSDAVGQASLSFLSLMTPGDGDASGYFAPNQGYGGAAAPARAQLASGEARLWGRVYGGTADLDGNAVSGAAGLSASNYGFVGGVDTRFNPSLLAGLTVGIGRQNFNSGASTGDSNDVMLGAYLRQRIGNAYLSGAVAYGWHSITTSRIVTVSGTDLLNARFTAHDLGGRFEGGWRVEIGGISLTPYAAWTRSSFEAPAYAEAAAGGAATFALSYSARTTASGRTELGAHLGHDFVWEDGNLNASLNAAWGHQLDDAPFIQAAFTGLSGSTFQVVGARVAPNSALLGGAVTSQTQNGLSYGAALQTQLGPGTTIFEGMGTLGWHW